MAQSPRSAVVKLSKIILAAPTEHNNEAWAAEALQKLSSASKHPWAVERSKARGGQGNIGKNIRKYKKNVETYRKIYQNIYKIYKIYKRYTRYMGPGPRGRAGPGRRRLVFCIYLVYILYISCIYLVYLVYICIYLYIYFDIF